MQAAIAKRLATIAVEYERGRWNRSACPKAAGAYLPSIGAALIRAGKVGASAKTLAHAAGCKVDNAQAVLRALECGGFAHRWGADGEVWRVDTVQILAREERAALEALHAATAHEREAAAVAVAKKLKDAIQAQTGGKNGGR